VKPIIQTKKEKAMAEEFVPPESIKDAKVVLEFLKTEQGSLAVHLAAEGTQAQARQVRSIINEHTADQMITGVTRRYACDLIVLAWLQEQIGDIEKIIETLERR
jgi:hypothetical protein